MTSRYVEATDLCFCDVVGCGNSAEMGYRDSKLGMELEPPDGWAQFKRHRPNIETGYLHVCKYHVEQINKEHLRVEFLLVG